MSLMKRPTTPFTTSNQLQRIKDALELCQEKQVDTFCNHSIGDKEIKENEGEGEAPTPTYRQRDAKLTLGLRSKIWEDDFKKDKDTYARFVDKTEKSLAMEASRILRFTCLMEDQESSLDGETDPFKVLALLRNFFFKRGDQAAVEVAEASFNRAVNNLSLAKKDIDKYLLVALKAFNSWKAADSNKNDDYYSPEKLIGKVLFALGTEVYPFVVTELKTSKDMTWQKLRGHFLSAEQKKNLKASKNDRGASSGSEDEQTEDEASTQSALVTKAYKEGMAQGVALATRGFNTKMCTGCGKPNHAAEGCWKLHPELKPEWARKRRGGANKA